MISHFRGFLGYPSDNVVLRFRIHYPSPDNIVYYVLQEGVAACRTFHCPLLSAASAPEPDEKLNHNNGHNNHHHHRNTSKHQRGLTQSQLLGLVFDFYQEVRQ